MKTFFFSLLMLPAWLLAQDTYTGASTSAGSGSEFKRTFSLYLYGNSGNLNADAAPVFQDNDTELGLMYSQNFETAPWLTLGVSGEFSAVYQWNHGPDNRPILDSGRFPQAAIPVFGLSLGLSPYVRLDVTTEGLLSLNLFYTYNGGAHFFTLLATMDIRFINFQNSEYTLGASYEYKLGERWVFNTLLGFRFGGTTAAAARNTFHIRWDNLVGYRISKAILWARLRYEPRAFLIPNGSAKHEVMLMGGVSYTFDFSKL